MITRTLVGSAITALALVACGPQAPAAPPAPDAAAIRTALDQEVAKFGSILEKKDAAGVAAAFAADATWILPDATTSVGTAAIEAAAKAFFSSYESMKVESNGIDKLIVLSDSTAFTSSHDVYTVTMKGKKPEHRQNPYADYWVKTAGGWKIAYEINADGPMAAAKKP